MFIALKSTPDLDLLHLSWSRFLFLINLFILLDKQEGSEFRTRIVELAL